MRCKNESDFDQTASFVYLGQLIAQDGKCEVETKKTCIFENKIGSYKVLGVVEASLWVSNVARHAIPIWRIQLEPDNDEYALKS